MGFNKLVNSLIFN